MAKQWTRYARLRQYVEQAGVPVLDGSGNPPVRVPDAVAEWSGMPKGIKVQGTYKRSTGGSVRMGIPAQGPTIHMNLPEHSPEWLYIGVLAHEYGHHIDYEMGEYHAGTQFDREQRASLRGYELLVALGIAPSDAVRSVFNMSMASYRPNYWGYERTREEFV